MESSPPTRNSPALVPAPPVRETTVSRGVIYERRSLLARLNAWRKRTPLNPYWTELFWVHRSVAQLAQHAQGRLLDVGVGERPHAALFEPRIERYIGLEYPPMADNLSPGIWQRLERVRGIIDVWGDGGALPFAAGSFDTLLALEVLEHVPDPGALVLEFARVLRPGGTLLVSVPFAAPLHQLPYDYQRFTEQGLRALAERCGLRVESIEPRGNFAAVVGSLRAQHMLRCLGASERLHDGSVRVSRLRGPFVFPLVALIQLFYRGLSACSNDTSCPMGYSLVARKE